MLNVTNNCTGCGACTNACPVNAIQMELNDEGFLYPEVDMNKCVGCNLCTLICTVSISKIINSNCKSFSARAASDQIRQNSSSGGIFGVLAEEFVEKGGVVFGAIYKPEEKGVQHVSTLEVPLIRIMRSKYGQSNVGYSYRKVKDLCEKGIPVLFSGTPCQIAGLKAYLIKDYEYLVTVDFMCHGVPSSGFFRDVVKYYEAKEKSEVLDYTFREKDFGWRKQITKIYFRNGKVLTFISRKHFYYNLFLHNYTLRKSCYLCERYKSHVSDITLADHWRIRPEVDDNQGTSLIFINTQRGAECLQRSREDLILGDEMCMDSEIYTHKKYNLENRDRFFQYYEKHGMKKTINHFSSEIKRYQIRNKLFKAFHFPMALLCRIKSKLS